MTQYPEAFLARELGMCYVNISLITDYDAGLEGHPEVEPVSHGVVVKVFKKNNEKLRELIGRMVNAMPIDQPVYECGCPDAVSGARAE